MKRGLEDLQLAHDTCVALTKIASVKKDIKEAPAKLDADHELFGSLRRIVVEGARDASTSFYIPAAQKALVVAYQFAEQPDVLCGGWLKEICRGVVRSRNESGGSWNAPSFFSKAKTSCLGRAAGFITFFLGALILISGVGSAWVLIRELRFWAFRRRSRRLR